MASAGANAINNVVDRDIDRRMSRTQSRPIVRGSVTPRRALIFGIVLNVAAFALLYLLANLLSAALTLCATLFYVFVYTKGLKRTTPQNIVIGGAAGAVPPMVGWAAVTGTLNLPALYLFTIIFFWTPPHFWALSLLLKKDYAEANIPMLPVVSGEETTKKWIFLYTLVLIVLTITFFATGAVSWIYLGSALLLGTFFIFFSWRLLRLPGISGAKSTYIFSLAYLALLFLAVIADSVLMT